MQLYSVNNNGIYLLILIKKCSKNNIRTFAEAVYILIRKGLEADKRDRRK